MTRLNSRCVVQAPARRMEPAGRALSRCGRAGVRLVRHWVQKQFRHAKVNRELTDAGYRRGTGCLVRHATLHFRHGLQR
jgi:hypothetical protein